MEEGHNKYAIIGLKALKRAAFKVSEDARRNNYKIPIWRDGRIVYEIPGPRIRRSSGQLGASASDPGPD